MTRKRLQALLDKLEPRMRRRTYAYLRAVKTDPSATLAAIEGAIESGGAAQAVEAILADVEAAAGAIASEGAAISAESGAAVAEHLTEKIGKLISYDGTNARAVAMLQRSRLSLVQDLVGTQRDAVLEAISYGLDNGINPRTTAIAIRDSIGLTADDVRIVANYRRKLEEVDPRALAYKLRDMRSDRSVKAAIDAAKPLPQAKIDKLVEKYADKRIAFRAESIARTETLRAIHEAQDEGYEQGIESGKIDESRLQASWRTGPRSRAWHKSMDGQKRKFREPFISGNGVLIKHPHAPGLPADEAIRCNCSKLIRVLPVDQVAVNSGGMGYTL